MRRLSFAFLVLLCSGALLADTHVSAKPGNINNPNDQQDNPGNPNIQLVSGGNPGPQLTYGGPSPGDTTQTVTAIARALSTSPMFALTAGLASILGLLLTLYASQVRTIPFSLYRSLMWRKALLLSNGIGLLVFGGTRFYMQDQAPFLPPLRELHIILTGELRVSPVDNLAHGPTVWAVIGAVGIVLFLVSLVYDPAALARRIMIREQDALHIAQDKQVDHLTGRRKIEDLSATDRQVLGDTIDYFNHLQWRFADVVLGPPPPTFPLLYRRATSPKEAPAESRAVE